MCPVYGFHISVQENVHMVFVTYVLMEKMESSVRASTGILVSLAVTLFKTC